jgi:hypothetical protein
LSADLQENPGNTGQQNTNTHTDDILKTINNYVQQFDTKSSAEAELPSLQDVIKQVDDTLQSHFQDALQRARANVEKTQSKDTQRAGELKTEALERLPEFQDYVRRVVYCFLKGYHYKAQMLRGTANAKNKLGNIQIDNPGDVGEVLDKKRKEKHDLGNFIDFIHNARPVLDKIDRDAQNLEQGLYDMLGEDNGAAAMRSVTSELRKQDFEAAAKAAKDIQNKKAKGLKRFKSGQLPELARQAEKLVDFYKNNSARLFTGNSRSFLRAKELDFAMTQAKKEFDAAEGYLRKYYVAYLVSKRQSVEQARERLKTLESPENALNSHRRLIHALGEVVSDPDATYSFEGRHVVPVKKMVSEQAEEIQRIEQRLDRHMTEFDDVMEDMANY